MQRGAPDAGGVRLTSEGRLELRWRRQADALRGPGVAVQVRLRHFEPTSGLKLAATRLEKLNAARATQIQLGSGATSAMRTKIGVLTCTSWALKLSLSTMEMSTAGVDASIGRLALVCAFCPGEPSSEASGPSKVVSTSTVFSAKPPMACKKKANPGPDPKLQKSLRPLRPRLRAPLLLDCRRR